MRGDAAGSEDRNNGTGRETGMIHLWPEAVRADGASVVASATIEMPGGGRQTLWYKVPESQTTRLNTTCDPLVVGSIQLLMQTGQDVRVHGQVSPSLLRNLAEFQAVWASWLPGLRSVEIVADREVEAAGASESNSAIVAFSGGVDSCFTAFRHARRAGGRNPYRVTAGLMVHGFDIPLDEPDAFASAATRSEAMLTSLGVELITVATNFRDIVPDWNHSYGTAVASCLMLFAGGFRAGLIGQGLAYVEVCLQREGPKVVSGWSLPACPLGVRYEGSNPLTDPLLSTDGFSIIPDGAAFDRAEKILAMSSWREFLTNVRVCWAGPQKDRNCCKCEKCIRNILTFRALGLGLPPCFPHDVSDAELSVLSLGAGADPFLRYGALRSLAASRGTGGQWVRILDKRLTWTWRFERSSTRRRIAKLRYYLGRIAKRLSLRREAS
jgi:hypothetical protein